MSAACPRHPAKAEAHAAATLAPAAPPSLHAALRQGTRHSHARIEAALALDRLGTDPHAVARYGRVLQALALFHGHWQPQVRAALPAAWRGWLDDAPRQRWLADDLAALGLDWPDAHTGDARYELGLVDALEALASLYVVEGSALGGQVIVRSLGRQAPALQGRACRYFSGHGTLTGARWQAFGELMATAGPALAATPAAQARAVRAADATFWALLQAAQDQQATVQAGPGLSTGAAGPWGGSR
ncbi:biliverdin-producing heme oxygenase [Aquabacterium sp. OR-4]|uniref:biliverdin-producing heme oxygenase n=1 Tax=Aquabacterium sp. OR-4 TaxID=2978127 RepID=UPI0028C9EAE6|nr:biliverdin-producing heme oxygenase [Aquabacterium sp. OR-4]MDT7835100.1 biliverdin-producing heme oxygenase [Aquabacterium sp. OR-4]